MTSDEIERTYLGAFTDEFHRDLVRLISSKCIDSMEECSVYRKERASNLYPYLRRTQIEENVELLVEDYPEIKPHVRRLGTNNCVTELRREIVLLTIHKVAHRNSKVRPAVQRQMLAKSSQANLFGDEEIPSDEAILYAQLKYGTAKRFPEQLSFVVVDFPDKDGNVVHSINLLARLELASLLDKTKETRIEAIDDALDLGLRSDARNKDRKGGIIGPQNESPSNNNKVDESKDKNGDKDEDEN